MYQVRHACLEVIEMEFPPKACRMHVNTTRRMLGALLCFALLELYSVLFSDDNFLLLLTPTSPP